MASPPPQPQPQPAKSLFGKLQSGLDFLDGAFKEAVEKSQDEGAEEGELLEDVAAQRLQRKQRLDAAGKAAPFGSALAPPPPGPSLALAANDDKGAFILEAEGGVGLGLGLSAPAMANASTPVRAVGGQGAGEEDTDDAVFHTARKGGQGHYHALHHAPQPPSTGAEAATPPSLPLPPPSSSSPAPAPAPPTAAAAAASAASAGRRRLSLSSSFSSSAAPSPSPLNTGAASALAKGENGSGGGAEEQQLQLKQLRKAVRELNEENAECERRILGQERELQAAAEALAHTNAKAAARESELLDELKELRKAKGVDRGQYQAALASKDASIRALEQEVVSARTELETSAMQIAALRREVAASLEQREALAADLALARSNQERGVEGLRRELKAAEAQIDEMKAQHAAWARQAQLRESGLEATNAQLTESLAASQRAVEGWKAKAEAAAGGDAAAAAGRAGVASAEGREEELRRLQRELQSAQGALEMERRHVVSLQREVRAQQHELGAAQTAWREEKERGDARLGKATARQHELEAALAAAEAALAEFREQPGGGSREEVEGRLRMLSDQLVKKQASLDSLACEKYALAARLAAAEQRAGAFEAQVAELSGGMMGGLRGGAGAGGGDLEGAGGGDMDALALTLRNRNSHHHHHGPTTSNNNTKPAAFLLPTTSPSLFRRPPFPVASASGGLRPLSRLPLCHARPQLAAAADGFDRLVASALHGLRVYPLLRLACLGYLLLLHVWAFGLLAFHSQRLEAVHADVGGSVAPGLVLGGGGAAEAAATISGGGGD